jgi:hypothetical protein
MPSRFDFGRYEDVTRTGRACNALIATLAKARTSVLDCAVERLTRGGGLVSPQISYKYLPPGTELTGEAFAEAEPLHVRQADDLEIMAHPAAGELVRVPDLRRGGEEGNFEVVRVGNRTISGFVEDPSRPIDNLNVYVTDAE